MSASRRRWSIVLAASALVLVAGVVPVACSDFKGADVADASTEDGSADDGATASDGSVGSEGGDGATTDGGGDGGGGGKHVCTAAACPPTTLAADLHIPFALAVNATHVYWLEQGTSSDLDGELVRIAKGNPCLYSDAGCRGVLDPLVGGSVINYVSMGLGPNDVCYTETYNFPAQHSVDCIGLASGVKRAVVQGNGAVGGIEVHADAIYWANLGTSLAAKNGGVFRVAEDAGFTTTPPAVATARAGVNAVTVDGVDLFWGETGAPDAGGGVYHALVDGGARTTVASGQAEPVALAVFGDTVYWVNLTDGTVRSARRDGTQPRTLASGQVSPFAVVVDASGVYWANAGTAPDYLDGAVRHVDPATGTITDMMTSVAAPSAIAVDGAYVYVASMGTQGGQYTDGKVLRIAKTY